MSAGDCKSWCERNKGQIVGAQAEFAVNASIPAGTAPEPGRYLKGKRA